MRNKYQRPERKSNHKFEIVRGQEMLVLVPLPIAKVWAEMQAQVEEPTGQAELQILRAILERSGLSGWLAQIKDARGQSYFPTAMVP